MPAKRIVINLGAGTRTELPDGAAHQIVTCQHRGPQLEGEAGIVRSKLCGDHGRLAVFKCNLHGTNCTARRWCRNQEERVCQSCEDRLS